MENRFTIKMKRIGINILIAIHIDHLKQLLLKADTPSKKSIKQDSVNNHCDRSHCPDKKIMEDFIMKEISDTLNQILALAQDHDLDVIACECKKVIAYNENYDAAVMEKLGNLIKIMEKEIS
ncbi:hypothetical protein [Chromobacterium violaceum]|uniref:hypothetical protein n=1 Tax=Chromobacterium violaceum TaxID=536 RepID=UPI0015F84415|nr:hypothetical protein [Chromobacterium violaceum]MBA8733832.1 hypothetical protein [Chromobacterium violaceum]